MTDIYMTNFPVEWYEKLNRPDNVNSSNNVNPSNDGNTRILAKRPLPPPQPNQCKRRKPISPKAGLHLRTASVPVGAGTTDPLTGADSSKCFNLGTIELD